MFYSFVQKICAAFFAKFGIHMAVFSGGIVGRCFPLCTLTILYQQRGSHRRLGNAHGAREDPEASFRRARNAPWAAVAGCIMPPNLFGHTMSGHSWGPHEVAYFVGKGETNGAIELSRLRGSERYAVCFDARQAAVAGLKAAKAPSMSCESCQALSALLPIAGARAANTA